MENSEGSKPAEPTSLPPTIRYGAYYMNELQQERDRLLAEVLQAEADLESGKVQNERSASFMRCAIGNGRMMLSKNFTFFESLCRKYWSPSEMAGEEAIVDLADGWHATKSSLTQVHIMFKAVADMRSRNWVRPTDEPFEFKIKPGQFMAHEKSMQAGKVDGAQAVETVTKKLDEMTIHDCAGEKPEVFEEVMDTSSSVSDNHGEDKPMTTCSEKMQQMPGAGGDLIQTAAIVENQTESKPITSDGTSAAAAVRQPCFYLVIAGEKGSLPVLDF